MTETSRRPAEAEALVAEKRRKLADGGESHRSALAQALVELSRALEEAGRDDDALAAAEESVRVLEPAFGARQSELSEPMRSAASQYVALAQRLRRAPDKALLAPVAQVLGDVTRREDAAEDEAQ